MSFFITSILSKLSLCQNATCQFCPMCQIFQFPILPTFQFCTFCQILFDIISRDWLISILFFKFPNFLFVSSSEIIFYQGSSPPKEKNDLSSKPWHIYEEQCVHIFTCCYCLSFGTALHYYYPRFMKENAVEIFKNFVLRPWSIFAVYSRCGL